MDPKAKWQQGALINIFPATATYPWRFILVIKYGKLNIWGKCTKPTPTSKQCDIESWTSSGLQYLQKWRRNKDVNERQSRTEAQNRLIAMMATRQAATAALIIRSRAPRLGGPAGGAQRGCLEGSGAELC